MRTEKKTDMTKLQSVAFRNSANAPKRPFQTDVAEISKKKTRDVAATLCTAVEMLPPRRSETSRPGASLYNTKAHMHRPQTSTVRRELLTFDFNFT